MARYEEPDNESLPRFHDAVPTWMEQGVYINPENAFIKHLTERQPIPGIVDVDKLKEYNHRVFFSGKEKSTAFVGNPKTIQVNTCMRMNLSLMESLGLENLKWAEVWDNIDIMVITQGQSGNLVNAMITKKQEFKDTSKKELTSLKEKLFGRKEQPQEQGY